MNKLRDNVLRLAMEWADYQDADSLADQATDHGLRMAAELASDRLRDAVEKYREALIQVRES